MKTVTLIDYGIGNLLSVQRAFEHVGADLQIATTEQEILAADKVILPGVGAFTSCTGELDKRGLSDAVRETVEKQKPLFGICVGMQMLFENSEEFGINPGFGFLKGIVQAIPREDQSGRKRRTPHIGWTPLQLPRSRNSWNDTLLKDTKDGAEVYFVHSFTAVPQNDNDRLADSDYEGCTVSAMVAKGNLFGTQFHPEKSGPVGLKIIENFVNL